MDNNFKTDNKSDKIKNAKINEILGKFILFFGIVILVAIYFTQTFIGQMTNLVAGVILIAIGAGMAFQAIRSRKRIENG